MRIGILGASGFIGGHLVASLRKRGDEVLSASLRDPAAAARKFASCDAIVNLAGEPIVQRWSPAAKARIRDSRTIAPAHFLVALSEEPHRAEVYLSASAIGYYGTSESATFTETSPPGNDFLAEVCIGWEATAQAATELGMRVACLRTGLVLGGGGALAAMLPPFRLGLGGRIGSGRQWYSWIHVHDLIGIYLMALDGAQGVLNATSPVPVTNAEFTRTLGAALHRPVSLPTPTFALRLLLGDGADVVLYGQRVLPERTEALGYRFAFPNLEPALDDILG